MTSEVQADNGVNVEALLAAREALTNAPEAAQFKWRAACEWKDGTHSHSTVESFYGLGQDQHRKTTFSFDADHPEVFAAKDHYGILGIDSDVRNGFSGITVKYDIDADAKREDIEALVAQSQKRSAVYDIVTNPTNVTVVVR